MTYALRFADPLAHTAPLTGLPSTHPAVVEPLGGRAVWSSLLAAREADGLLPASAIPGAMLSTLAASLVGRFVLAPVSTSPGARWGLFVVALDGVTALARLPTGDAWALDANTPAAVIVDRDEAFAAHLPTVLVSVRAVLAGSSSDGSTWWAVSTAGDESTDAAVIARRAPSLRTAAPSTLGALAPSNAVGVPSVLVKVSETRWRVVRW